MRLFFDTSVLVHEHHERSIAAFSTPNRSAVYCAAHGLTEVYATLTRLPEQIPRSTRTGGLVPGGCTRARERGRSRG